MRYGVFSVRCSVQWSWPTTFCRVRTGPGLAGNSACLCPVVKCVIRGSKGGVEGGTCANSDICQDTGRVLTCADSASVVNVEVARVSATFQSNPFLIEVAQSSATLVCYLEDNDRLLTPWSRVILVSEIFSVGPRIIVQSWTHARLRMCADVCRRTRTRCHELLMWG